MLGKFATLPNKIKDSMKSILSYCQELENYTLHKRELLLLMPITKKGT